MTGTQSGHVIIDLDSARAGSNHQIAMDEFWMVESMFGSVCYCVGCLGLLSGEQAGEDETLDVYEEALKP